MQLITRKDFDTRAADLLASCVCLVISVATYFSPNSYVYESIARMSAFPEWIVMAMMCSIIGIFSVFIGSVKLQSFCRFLSGCVWGSLIMLYTLFGEHQIILWIACTLFSFDITSVILKGKVWTRKNLLSEQGHS
jgi:hypothetical protein